MRPATNGPLAPEYTPEAEMVSPAFSCATLTGTILTNAVDAVVCTATLWPFRSSRLRVRPSTDWTTPPVAPR